MMPQKSLNHIMPRLLALLSLSLLIYLNLAIVQILIFNGALIYAFPIFAAKTSNPFYAAIRKPIIMFFSG